MATLQSRLTDLINAFGADIKILRGVSNTTTLATLTPTSAFHQYELTAQNQNMTIANPTGSPSSGQSMLIRIKDAGVSRTIAFGTQYRAIGVTLPTATTVSKTLYIGCIYNAADTKWDVLAVGLEA